MTKTVTATEAKAKLLALLDAVERGEEIEITRRGRAVAKLAPVARSPMWLKNRFAGIVTIHATDDELFTTGEHWEAS